MLLARPMLRYHTSDYGFFRGFYSVTSHDRRASQRTAFCSVSRSRDGESAWTVCMEVEVRHSEPETHA